MKKWICLLLALLLLVWLFPRTEAASASDSLSWYQEAVNRKIARWLDGRIPRRMVITQREYTASFSGEGWRNRPERPATVTMRAYYPHVENDHDNPFWQGFNEGVEKSGGQLLVCRAQEYWSPELDPSQVYHIDETFNVTRNDSLLSLRWTTREEMGGQTSLHHRGTTFSEADGNNVYLNDLFGVPLEQVLAVLNTHLGGKYILTASDDRWDAWTGYYLTDDSLVVVLPRAEGEEEDEEIAIPLITLATRGF